MVDDDRFSQRLMQDMLVPLGYAVSVAGDGLAAIELARRIRPHLVLLDVVMPLMDGFEACERLKADAVTAHIPVVLVTSLEGRESKIRGLAVGASDFLAKPVDEAELALRVKNLLRVVEFEAFLQQHNEQLDAQVRERTRQLEDALGALRRSREELKTSYLDTIFRLTTVAEYKDGFTSGHIKRVGHYCRHLARELGWSEEEQESIFYASPMHDIGKVVIPTEILQKPGPLTAEEFAIVKGHTTAGARILQGSTSAFLQLAEVIALTHHERFNGGGYPRGLRGEDLPLAGMIMSIADQYEALRSERPYKPPLTHEHVVDIITRGDGRTEPSHFHPQVLEAFADSTGTFAAIFEEFAAASSSRPLFQRLQEGRAERLGLPVFSRPAPAAPSRASRSSVAPLTSSPGARARRRAVSSRTALRRASRLASDALSTMRRDGSGRGHSCSGTASARSSASSARSATRSSTARPAPGVCTRSRRLAGGACAQSMSVWFPRTMKGGRSHARASSSRVSSRAWSRASWRGARRPAPLRSRHQGFFGAPGSIRSSSRNSSSAHASRPSADSSAARRPERACRCAVSAAA